ncbi:MAG TPA: hypothetical protein VLA16_01590 [Ideonella sp.]|nr:hypothetical protein [Ideonella sp.]
MPTHTAKAVAPAIRRPMVWLLVLAIMVYGHSAVLVQLLGPAHRHEASAAIATASPLSRIEGLFRDLRMWRADLHARLLPQGFPSQAHLHATAAGHAHSHEAWLEAAHTHAHGAHEPLDAVAPVTIASANNHAALHGSYQRHHHDPHDPSVVTLDGLNGDSGPDSASPSTAGSATLPLALAPGWALPSPSGRTLAWPTDRSDRWTDAALRLSERPPRA